MKNERITIETTTGTTTTIFETSECDEVMRRLNE